MKNSVDVFDFKDEDELPEFTASKILEKFKNPSLDSPANLKYDFLECVAQGTDVQKKEIGNVPCVDIDAIDCDQSCDVAFTSAAPGTGEEVIIDAKEGNTCLDVAIKLNSASCEQNPCVKEDNDESGSYHPELKSRDSCPDATSPGKCLLDCSLADCPSSNEPVDMILNVDETMNESSPSSPASETVEDGVSLNGHLSDRCSGDVEMDETVVLHPDYVEYWDNLYTGFIARFSRCGIEIMDSTACGNQGTFSFERGIDDIIDIQCQWLQKMGLVNVKLHILSKDAVQDGNAHGASEIQELKFVVVEPCWSEKQEAIISLNVKYLPLWNVVLDEDVEMAGDKPFTRRCYLPSFDEPFEDVVYPKGDIDAVSINKRDVDLLQPETFINDTIIDFYIKYLKNQIPPEDKHKYHFFNSFFFRKLADLDKDPSSISDGRAAFLRVHKWTKKVDIFGKEYLFVPVNFNLHWSLIVICHPGEVASFKDEGDKSLKVPCILHMDSIKGSHAGLKNLVQRYLWEEWKERHKEISEDISSKFISLRFVALELPQQENSFDCGLFLLHYLELFLAEAPENFSPFKITKISNFLNANWFPPSEVSLKRALIQRLIFELLENRSREATSAVCSDEHRSSKFPDNNKNEMGVECISEKCSPAIACHGNSSTSEAGQGIEMTLLAESSVRNVRSVNESGLVLREFFEPGASAASLLGQYQSYGQPSSYYHLSGATSPREEDVETGGEFVYLPSGESGFQQISGITPEVGSISYMSSGFGTSWNPGSSMQGEHKTNSSAATSAFSSDDSEDIGIIENVPVGEDLGLSQEEGTDHQRSPSVENMECLTDGPASAYSGMLQTPTVEGLQAPDKLQDGNGNGELLFGEGNPTILVHQETNMLENSLHQDSETEIADNREVACDDLKMIGNDCLAELHGQPAAKRMRLTPPLEGDEKLKGSLSKDLHL